MKANIKNLRLIFLTVALIAVIALTGCEKSDNGSNSAATTTSSSTAEKASVEFSLEVTDDKGEITTFTISTTEKTVGQALLNEGLIEGSESDYGLYIEVVNGLKADYNVDGSYWAFYIDGEYAMSGADVTQIETGEIYSFVYTKD